MVVVINFMSYNLLLKSGMEFMLISIIDRTFYLSHSLEEKKRRRKKRGQKEDCKGSRKEDLRLFIRCSKKDRSIIAVQAGSKADSASTRTTYFYPTFSLTAFEGRLADRSIIIQILPLVLQRPRSTRPGTTITRCACVHPTKKRKRERERRGECVVHSRGLQWN